MSGSVLLVWGSGTDAGAGAGSGAGGTTEIVGTVIWGSGTGAGTGSDTGSGAGTGTGSGVVSTGTAESVGAPVWVSGTGAVVMAGARGECPGESTMVSTGVKKKESDETHRLGCSIIPVPSLIFCCPVNEEEGKKREIWRKKTHTQHKKTEKKKRHLLMS